MLDVVIVGSGPAGLSAAVYARRAKLKVLVVEKAGYSGGQIVNTSDVDNYLGLQGIDGFEMAMKFRNHAEYFGAEFLDDEVVDILEKDNVFEIVLKSKEVLNTKAVIIATGAKYRKLEVPGEVEYTGRGVSYCATCDGAFNRGKVVAVVGGGDVALEDALYLSNIAEKVYLIHRRDELRAAKSIQEKAFKNEKLFFMWDTVVEEVAGDEILSEMTVKNVKTGELTKIVADEDDGMFGVFGFIGTIPNSKLFEGIIDMDERGYIKADENMNTNIPGVYAAGDVRVKSLRQVVTAAADGAIAATQVERGISGYL
jgi:thioredoxin reductase (NADPH)